MLKWEISIPIALLGSKSNIRDKKALIVPEWEIKINDVWSRKLRLSTNLETRLHWSRKLSPFGGQFSGHRNEKLCWVFKFFISSQTKDIF